MNQSQINQTAKRFAALGIHKFPPCPLVKEWILSPHNILIIYDLPDGSIHVRYIGTDPGQPPPPPIYKTLGIEP